MAPDIVTEKPIFSTKDSSAGGGNGPDDDMTEMLFAKRGCCFWIPCLRSDQPEHETPGCWERIRTAEKEDRWWTKGWKAALKAREWSELMAGPKWKTFIRRLTKKGGGRGGGGGGGGKNGKYQYDPLSYALNFDEGPGQYGDLDDDLGFPDFSSRYAPVPLSTKSSMDLGKDGPSFS